MAFLESRLDPRIERGAKGGPTNRGRRKVYSSSGRLRQAFEWSAPLYEFDVSHGMQSDAGFESLLSMWYVVNFTPYEGFRFRDPRDYIATATNSTLTLITGNTWQLERKYTFASVTHKRSIKKPNTGVAIFDVGGSPCTFGVDTTTGIATVTAGTPSYWTGTFDVPVTFKDNALMATLESAQGNTAAIADPVLLEEIRL